MSGKKLFFLSIILLICAVVVAIILPVYINNHYGATINKYPYISTMHKKALELSAYFSAVIPTFILWSFVIAICSGLVKSSSKAYFLTHYDNNEYIANTMSWMITNAFFWIGITIILGTLGLDLKPIITLVSLFGLSMLMDKNGWVNIKAALTLVRSKSFYVGETIEVKDTRGIVARLTWSHVILLAQPNAGTTWHLIYIANSDLANGNYHRIQRGVQEMATDLNLVKTNPVITSRGIHKEEKRLLPDYTAGVNFST